MIKWRPAVWAGAPRRFGAAAPQIHPKLAVEHLGAVAGCDFFQASKVQLNVVFKPGAFGGQLMAQSLNAAHVSSASAANAHTGSSLWVLSSQMSSFMGPVLLESDVYYRVSTIRQSGKAFLTKRVQAFQLEPEEKLDGVEEVAATILHKPVLFESTVALYRAGQPRTDVVCPADLPVRLKETQNVLEDSLSLEDVAALIKGGHLRRGVLYRTAMHLARKMSLPDLLLSIRFPKKDVESGVTGSNVTGYWVGIHPSLHAGLGPGNAARLLLPYTSDGMTQVLAFSDPLDSLWEAWPRSLTVWNYGMWFSQSTPPDLAPAIVGSPPTETKWFFLEYSMQGLEHDLGIGHVKLFDWPSKNMMASSTFHALCRK